MTTKEAAIKLNLDAGNYATAIKRVGDETAREGQRAEKALSPLGGGINRLKSDFAGLGSKMKDMLGTAATLGGALSVGALSKGAVEAEVSYIQLANQMGVFAEKTIDAADAQKAVENAADASKASLERVRGAAHLLAAAADGDVGKLEDALTRSQLQAKRLRVDSELLANVYSRLLAKGVTETAEETENLIERMNVFGQKVLGLPVDEALDPNDIAEFAGFVNGAGSNVAEMTALLGHTGKTAKDLGQALEIVEELGLVLNTRKGLAELRKETGLTERDINMSRGALDNLFTVLEKGGPKAFKKLQDALGTDRSRKAIEELLGEEMAIKLEGGKVDKTEFELKVRSLRDSISAAAAAGVDRAHIDEQNAELTNTSAARFQTALNKVEEAFQKPEVTNAMEKLAEHLPAFADGVADIVEFFAKNPLTAGAIAVGGKAALSIGTGAITTALAGKAAAGAAAAGAAGAAGTAATAAGTAGAAGAAGAASGGAAAVLGPAAIIAAAAVAANAIGREQIDRVFSEEQSAQNGLTGGRMGAVNAAQSKDLKTKEKALADLESSIQKAKDEAPGALDAIFGGLAGMAESVGLIDDAGPNRKAQHAAQVQAAQREAAELRRQIEEMKKRPPPDKAEARAKAEQEQRESKPSKVKLEDQDQLARTLANQLADRLASQRLRVDIGNIQSLSEAVSGSRGPLTPGGVRSGGGTGGV